MNERSRHDRIEDFRRLCRERGERCTVQRRVILDTILELENHPSADRIYDAVTSRIPGIARTTVYRTLEYLARMGVITKACHAGRATRFDPRTELHHHLVCLHCNEIVDFDHGAFDTLELPDTTSIGFEASDCRVQVRGICSKCQDMMREEESR